MSSVIRRTSELGIRMALGARTSDVMWSILRQTVLLAGAGALLGVPAAIDACGYCRSLSTLLCGLKATDRTTVAVVTLLLVDLAALAK